MVERSKCLAKGYIASWWQNFDGNPGLFMLTPTLESLEEKIQLQYRSLIYPSGKGSCQIIASFTFQQLMWTGHHIIPYIKGNSQMHFVCKDTPSCLTSDLWNGSGTDLFNNPSSLWADITTMISSFFLSSTLAWCLDIHINKVQCTLTH